MKELLMLMVDTVEILLHIYQPYLKLKKKKKKK